MSNSFKCVERAKEMVLELRALTEVPNIYKWLTTVCKSRSREFDIIF